MLKKITVLFSLVFVAGAVMAEEKPGHFNLSLLPSIQTSSNPAVEGLDLGLLATSKSRVEGVQTGFVFANTRETSIGLQLALVAKSEDFYGMKYGFVNIGRNFCGEASGFINMLDDTDGLASGFINSCGRVRGVMYGAVNVADEVRGVQLGFVNYTKDMSGIQIGLVNIISRSSLPVMVIVNGRFK